MNATVEITGQLSLFDLREEIPEFKPMLHKGQVVFVLSLDAVLKAKVGRHWECCNQYCGYDIRYEDGGGDTIWDYLIGKTVFLSETEATVEAALISYEKIYPEALNLVDCKSYEYYRTLDNHRLTATVAKVGDRQLYEHEFMCYHFLREYATTKARNDAYKVCFNKIKAEAERERAKELSVPESEILYKVTKDLYASRGYAERHMERINIT